MFTRKNKGKVEVGKVVNPSALQKIEMPPSDKVVIKEVPAKANDEVIGTCMIYEDGTFDVVVFEDISEQAKRDVYSFKQFMVDEFDMGEGNDGPAEQAEPGGS